MRNFTSSFSQLLTVFSRADFERLVREHRAERGAKGFDCWTQFVAMLFCQLGRAHSLREICGGLASVEGKLNHLGVGEAPARSTLSYANAHRPWELFEAVFGQLLRRCQGAAGSRPFRFKNKLYSLDASVIDLCLAMYDWAKFRRTKGAVKLHLLLDHDGCLPCYAVIRLPGSGKNHRELRLFRRVVVWDPVGSCGSISLFIGIFGPGLTTPSLRPRSPPPLLNPCSPSYDLDSIPQAKNRKGAFTRKSPSARLLPA